MSSRNDIPAEMAGGPRRRARRRLPYVGGRRRHLWWFGHTGVKLVPAMVLFLSAVVVLTLGLFAVRHFVFKPHEVAELPTREPLFAGEPSSNYGRPLSPAARMRVARFGIPLHMGPNGVPLIRDRATGAVRELTPAEQALPENEMVVVSEDNPDILESVSPAGGRVSWWEPRHLQGLPEPVLVDRVRWYERQEDQLNAAAYDMALAIEFAVRTPSDRWDDRWGGTLVEISDALVDEYAFGNPGYWQFASSFIVCSHDLEVVVTGGLGAGCPSPGLVQTVDRVYIAFGEITARLRRMGLAAELPYDPQVGGIYREVEVLEYLQENLVAIERLMEQVGVLFDDIARFGEAEGFYLDVRLP